MVGHKRITVYIGMVVGLALAVTAVNDAIGQPLLVPNQNGANLFPPGNGNNVNPNGNGNSQGGAAQADFDTLIDLIIDTIEPDSWDVVGGNGSIQGFPGGVYVDASGVMRRVDPSVRSLLAKKVWRQSKSPFFSENENDMGRSEARKVSLRRLEDELRKRQLLQQPIDDSIRYLAGLERIDFAVVDTLNNDVILVGPADRWIRDDDGRIVSRTTRRPVLQLDDLVVLLRNAVRGHSQFTCSITPTRRGLEQVQDYIDRTTTKPLPPNQRQQWIDGLRDALGNQTIEVEGISPATRVARVIVEADYHMKRIGIGLEPGTDGVVSYLDSIEIPKGQGPPPLGVLRWWFALSDRPVVTSEDGSTFDLTQPRVQVLSENELLDRRGERIHTGRSDRLNRQFAEQFTRHFDSLARRYPVYADLENVFELATVAAILLQERESDRLSWTMSLLLDEEALPVATARIPTVVPTVVNHRVINKKHIVCGVSGGVQFTGRDIQRQTSDQIPHVSTNSGPNWWWD